MCKPFLAVFGIWLSITSGKIENSVFPWCFSPGPNPASPQKDVCFKNHTDVSNIRWLGCWAPWVPGSITVRGGGLCYVPAIPTAAAEQNHRSYTVRTRHEGGRRTLTGYQATLPEDNGALLQVHRLCNTGEKSHNLVCEEICPTLRLWTVEQTTRSG